MSHIVRQDVARGFSLIEVMIAVLVLAFGVLALASLQGTLIRASAESKAQTAALSLAKDKLEELRTYRSIAEYRALADTSYPAVAVGGVSYSSELTVDRWAYSGAAFVAQADTVALPATYPVNKEFKRVQVTVSWTDAAGNPRTVTLEDAIAAADPTDSAKLAKINKAANARGPEVIIHNPANTDGVIPIAIGNNTDTAATNPTPEVAGRNSNGNLVVETRFDVMTYSALSGSTSAKAQSRVETAVIGCTCDLARGGGTPGARPTYWDGERYTVPIAASTAPPAGVATDLALPQSKLCTICCRDHHDPASLAPGQARFDPRRSSHPHYLVTEVNDAPVFTVASGQYQEACRIIRVDGIYRVAADAFNDHMDLLETKEDTAGVPERLPIPSAEATANYAGSTGFVLRYMGDRFVTGTNYNARLAMTPSPALHPTSVTISKSIFDYRWQHARGLYIDYLEPAAVARITQAKADCASRTPSPCTAAENVTAVLKLLPFTSINLSEIANWRSYGQRSGSNSNTSIESSDLIAVTNDDFLESILYAQPVRGNALPGFNIPANSNATFDAKVTAEIFESNSGLALMLDAVDPGEVTPVSDFQMLSLSGTGAAENSGTYGVTIAKGSNSNTGGYYFSSSSASFPRFASSPNVSRCSYSTKGGGKPNPYTCGNYNLGTTALPVPIDLTVSKYNYTDSSRTATTALSCSGVEGDRSYAGPYAVNYCKNYGVSASFPVTGASGTVTGYTRNGTDGSIGETTTIGFSNVRAGDQITIPLRFEGEIKTNLTCSYQVATASNGNKTYTYITTPAACP